MTDSNRPRHSLDDDDSFDEAFAFEDAPADYEDTEDGSAIPAELGRSGSAVPMRGLGMILLAVGIVLVGWGAFSLFGDDDDAVDNNAAETSASQPAATNQPTNQPQSSAPGTPAESNGAASSAQESAPAGQNPEAGAAKGGAAQQGAVNKAEQRITVLNNSPIQGLAGDTAKRLKGEQWSKTSFGNLPDTQGAFPDSAVFYPGNDANAKAAAEQLAKDLGIRAEVRNPDIDGRLANAHMLEGEGPTAVVVVTTNDMPR